MKIMKNNYHTIVCIVIFFSVFLSLLSGCDISEKEAASRDYGVFLSLDASDIDKIAKYKTVVIDAQYFSKDDIAYLKTQSCTVYSYLNVGAIENFRTYYADYTDLTLGDYENWDEEKWVDVSSKRWQDFLVSLENELLAKDIDGFFIDNCDVYYEYPQDAIFEGLTAILEHLMEYGKPVIINGGDTYVTEFQERGGSLSHIMTGVNQETVWSKINFGTDTFSEQSKSEREYFEDYVEACDASGLDVYLLEYTTDHALQQKIESYCVEKHFQYYISDSVELD